MIEGQISIRVIHGRDLWNADGKNSLSDPYAKVTFPKGKNDTTSLKTKTLDKTLNPVWDQKLTKKLKFTEGNYRPLYLKVYDDDAFGDDPLGYCEVDWKSCLENSGRWAINKIFKLNGPAE